MHSSLPEPDAKGMIFEDAKLYACLASFPLTRGHTVVVWKRPVRDIHLLKRSEYEHLMDQVDRIRNAMLEALKISKVYLLYFDEAQHVHWHLVPRYNIVGFTLLAHKPGRLTDYRLAHKIKEHLTRLP